MRTGKRGAAHWEAPFCWGMAPALTGDTRYANMENTLIWREASSMWVKTMTEEEIEQIAEAFAHYRYAAGEEGMFYLCPDEEAVKVYLRAFSGPG